MFTADDLTFVICAFGKNIYISDTIESLQAQTEKAHIIISTSTPSSYLDKIASKYGIPLFINTGEKGLAADWNFGYSKVSSQLVTIAHQDDLYESDYAARIIQAVNDAEEPVIVFTDYYELRNGKRVTTSRILKIKRKMNSIFKNRFLRKKHFWKRLVLSIGNPICCPSVTYNKKLCGIEPFDTKYANSCDYKAYIKLIEVKGSFVYISKILMGHRIYEESTTTKNISENIRQKEDIEIFEEFWPKSIAHLIYKVYSSSEKSNIIKKS